MGQVTEGLSPPTAMAFLAEDTILVFGKDNCTVRIVEDCEDADNDDRNRRGQGNDDHNRGQGRSDSDDD
ncbi:MAG TPA: hypothetical protein VJZ68_07480 [Nitrososphaera sp.]|nr:hypothetical protein [Nitrososphaera sp.]